jgi:hypothetical protein
MKTNIGLLIMAVLFAVSMTSCLRGCGSDKAKEEEPSSEYESGGGLVGAIKNMEKAVKNMEESINEPQEPINFREFKSNLKEKIDGMERVAYNGETSGVKGFKVSKADARYEDGDRKMSAEIMDVGGVAFVIMAMATWSAVEVDKESDTHTERTSTYRGHKVYEKYNSKNKSGEFSAILYDRFIVNLKGSNVTMDDFRDFFDKMGLSDLKKYKPKKKEE